MVGTCGGGGLGGGRGGRVGKCGYGGALRNLTYSAIVSRGGNGGFGNQGRGGGDGSGGGDGAVTISRPSLTSFSRIFASGK